MFNVSVFLACFAMCLFIALALFGTFLVARHTWWPMRLFGVFLAMLGASCFMAVLVTL